MKAKYKSAIRSKNMIRNAFLDLMKEKDFKKITVTDIINKTELNRSTFYAHYPDVRGVIEEIENELIDDMLNILSDFKYKDFFNNPTPTLLRINRVLENNIEFYRTLIQPNGADIFLEKLKNIFTNYMLSQTDIPKELKKTKALSIRICYFSGGIVNLYQQWFNEELDCSLNDISIEVSKLVSLGFKDLINHK